MALRPPPGGRSARVAGPRLARSRIPEIVTHYAAIIRALPDPPILIDRSFGGMFLQLLVDRGLRSAGVAINPAPPRGVLPGLTAFKANLPWVLASLSWRRTLRVSFGRFRASFLNTRCRRTNTARRTTPM